MQLIITEKPSVEANFNREMYATSDSLACPSVYYKFNYTDYSYPSEPKYIHYNNCKFQYEMKSYEEGILKTIIPLDFNNINSINFTKYTEIFILVEPDHSSVRGADIFLNHFLGSEQIHYPVTFALGSDYPFIEIPDMYANRLDYFNEPVNDNERIFKYGDLKKYREKYQLKDFIDFNFNGLMNKHFKTKNILLTRNKILTLLLLSRYHFDNDMDSNEVISIDMKDFSIGSIASQSDIIRALIDAKFISPKLFKITKKGLNFLEKLPALIKGFDSLMYFQVIEKDQFLSHEAKKKAVVDYLNRLFANLL